MHRIYAVVYQEIPEGEVELIQCAAESAFYAKRAVMHSKKNVGAETLAAMYARGIISEMHRLTP